MNEARAPQGAGKKSLDQGDVIAGKFIVERTIGMGGMGQVVCARHHELGTRVAIKVVHPYAADAENIGRFKREARAMATLTSEHAVRVYDVGENELGQPYMIMEYLDGRDLGSLLLERGPLPVDDVVEYMTQACEALIEAHDAGIVHRDLKPQNLFVTKRVSGDTHLRVLDFGLAKPFSGFGQEAKLTRPGDIIGTSQYMAPEQVRGQSLDGRTDIWGVGVCMYRLLTKEFPFPGPSATVICTGILSQEPVPLRQRRGDIRGDVESIVNRCLQKDPASRFQGMRDLATSLRNAKRQPSIRSGMATTTSADQDQDGGPASTTVNMPTPSRPATLPLGRTSTLKPPHEPVPSSPEWTSTQAMMPAPAPTPAPTATPTPRYHAPPRSSDPLPSSQPQMSQPQISQPQISQPQISQPQISQPQISRPPMAQASSVMPSVPPAPAATKKGSSKVVAAVILIGIWLCVALVVGVVLFVRSRPGAAVRSEPASSSTTTVAISPPPPPPPTLGEEPPASAAPPTTVAVASAVATTATAPPTRAPTTRTTGTSSTTTTTPRPKPAGSGPTPGGLYDHL